MKRLGSKYLEFKNNNEEYLKIKQAAEEIVKSVLTNSKLLLRFATASVIESLRRNSELYNDFLLYNNSATSNESNYLSFIPGQQDQQFSDIGDDIYTTVILEEAENLYKELTTKLTNEIITAAAAIRESSLPLPTNNNNRN
jgi:hypothetical protein